jgi:4-amino-4-deoxy-L-arabinose transferase-like glycosyltransferase
LVVLILAVASAMLLATAPFDKDFWWQDAPRHALNGVFVKDFLVQFPWRDPVGWAVGYYIKSPALTIMFYPPFFYLAEAVSFAVLGTSAFAAQLTVAAFTFILGIACYRLAGRVLPRWSALGVALLFIGAPEVAFWGRQVMLDIPAFASAIFSVVFLVDYLRHGRPRHLYLSAACLVIGIYTKFNVGFLVLPMGITFAMAKRRDALRDRHALIAVLVSAIVLAPAAYLFLHFGSVNIESVAGRPGDLPKDSLAGWLFYAKFIPYQLGWLSTVLAAGAALLFAVARPRIAERWFVALMIGWFTIGYLFFSAISVRESRHDLLILFPVALLIGLGVHRALGGGRPAQAAVMALGLATLGYSLIFDPVSALTGYRAAVDYVALHAPPNAVVVYSGYRDGDFVFDLRTHPERSDITVIRADKLLLRIAVERLRGVGQTDYSEAEIAAMLRSYGVSMVVAQKGFWLDLTQMARFADVLNSPDFARGPAFPLGGTLSSNDGRYVGGGARVEVFTPTYAVEPPSAGLVIDMPFIGDRFKGRINDADGAQADKLPPK